MSSTASTPDPDETQGCRRCGAPLPADAPASACWRCIQLLALGFGPQPPETSTRPLSDHDPTSTDITPERFIGSSPEPDPPCPVRLGDYLLEALISHGGMGVVYRARQASLDRVVALKLLLLGRYSSPESLKRFRREAQSAAALRHPHIVSIFEVGEADGQPFLAMEYVDGCSLAEVLRQGPLSPTRAAEYARVVADAIQFAHSQGVLHRDVKPSNVLLDAFDQVRLTDFGLAKKLDGSGDMTVTGEVLGSPNYLSPEQAAGRHGEVGPPSDIYGIGALLYELLTGRPPFMAQSIQDTLLHIRDAEPVAPVRLNPAVPRDLNTIVLKCLQKSPDRRYASAGDLADDLGRFLRQEPIAAHPTPAWERNLKWIRRHRARAILIATAAASLLALAAGSLWFSFRVERARNETEAANRRLGRNLFVREWSDAEQLLEEGRTIPALTWFARTLRRDPSNHVAAARLLSLLGDLTLSIPGGAPLVHTSAVLTADFSPDGRRLVTSCADGLVRVWSWRDPAPPSILPRTFSSPAAAFVPDMERVLVADRAGVSLWSSNGTFDRGRDLALPGSLRWNLSRDSQHAVLVSNETAPQLWDPRELRRIDNPVFADPSVRAVGFGADGRFLLRCWVPGSLRRWHVGLWEIASGRRVWQTKLPENPGAHHLHSAAVSDDGSLVALCRWGGQTLVYRIPEPEKDAPEPDAPDTPILHQELGQVARVQTFRFLDENRRLLIATTDGMVHQFDLTTGQALPDRIEHSGQVNAAIVSPDGTTLATASVDGMVRFWDLRPRRPEPMVIERFNAVWDIDFAPDGSWLVMGGDPDAEIRDLRTGALRHRLPMGRLISRVAVSPDGRRVVTCTEQGLLRIWEADSGKPVTPAIRIAERIHDLSFSTDGRWICVGAPSERVWLLDAETANPAVPEVSTGAPVVESVLTPDRSRLIAGTVHGDVHFWSLPDMKVLPTTDRHRGVVWATRTSRDGRLLATSSGDQTALIWDVASARVLREFRSEKPVYAAVFSPDGRRILIGSADRTARIKDVATGRQTSEIMRHPGGVWFAEYSPEGRLVATGDDAGFARLWDAESGLPLGNWLRSDASLKRIGFSPDGRRFVTASADRTVRIWPVVEAPSPAPAWVPDLAEAIAGRRLDDEESLHAVPFDRWRALRDRFTSETDPNSEFYARWARWFFVGRGSTNPPPFLAEP